MFASPPERRKPWFASSEIRKGIDYAFPSSIKDAAGNKVELMMYPSDSLHFSYRN